MELAGFAVGGRDTASASHSSTLGRWHSRGAPSYFPAGHPGVVSPAWQQGGSSRCRDKKATSHSPYPSPHSSQSFAPASTARSESQPGFKHLGLKSGCS